MIETDRLIIKPLSYDELSKHLISPEELANDLGLTASQSLKDKETNDAIMNDLLPGLKDPAKDPSFYTMWIVIEKSKNAIIGGICFHGEPDEEGTVEIGYGIDNDYRNKGFMTETLKGIILWLRNNKKVRIIQAETDSANISSIKVLEKNGFDLFKRDKNITVLKIELNK